MDDTLSKAVTVLNVTLWFQPLAAASTSAVAKLRPSLSASERKPALQLAKSLCFNLPTSKTAFDDLIDVAHCQCQRADQRQSTAGTQGSAKTCNARSRGQCYQSQEEHPHTRVVDPACRGPPTRQTRGLVQSESYSFDPSWPPRVLAWQPEYSLRLPDELDPLFRRWPSYWPKGRHRRQLQGAFGKNSENEDRCEPRATDLVALENYSSCRDRARTVAALAFAHI